MFLKQRITGRLQAKKKDKMPIICKLAQSRLRIMRITLSGVNVNLVELKLRAWTTGQCWMRNLLQGVHSYLPCLHKVCEIAALENSPEDMVLWYLVSGKSFMYVYTNVFTYLSFYLSANDRFVKYCNASQRRVTRKILKCCSVLTFSWLGYMIGYRLW